MEVHKMTVVKKCIVFCIYVEIFCAMQATGANNSSMVTDNSAVADKQKSIARSIWQHITKGYERIEFANNKSIVAVLGLSGTGKSTFVLFMTGNNTNMIAKPIMTEEDVFTGDYVIKDTTERIGESNIYSFTELPEKFVDGTTGTIYYDCPGFIDTRDPIYDMAGGFYIKGLLDSAQSVKIVLMANYNSLQSGADKHAFMFLVRHVKELIKNNVEKFRGGIALIAAKVADKADERIKATVTQYLKSVVKELHDENEKKLINILLEKDNATNYKFLHHIGRIRKEGFLSENQDMQENRAYLKKIVEKHLTYISVSPSDFDFTISNASRAYLKDVVANCHTEIKNTLSNLKQEINMYVNDLAKNMQITLKKLTDYHIPAETALEFQNIIKQLEAALKMLINKIESQVTDTNISEIIYQVHNNFPSELQPHFAAASKEIAIQSHMLGLSKQLKNTVTENSQKDNLILWSGNFKNSLLFIQETAKNLKAIAETINQKIIDNTRQSFQKSGMTLRHMYEEKESNSDNADDLYKEFNNITAILFSKLSGNNAVDCIYKTSDLLRQAKLYDDAAAPIISAMKSANNFEFLQIFSNKSFSFEACVDQFHLAMDFFKDGRNFYKIIIDSKNDLLQYTIQKDTSACLTYANKYIKSLNNKAVEEVEENCKMFAYRCINSEPTILCDVRTIGGSNVRKAKLSAFINNILGTKVEIKCENKKLLAKGTNIKISEVTKHGCWREATEIVIFALEKCFIDDDVDKSGMEAKVTIIARVIEVIGRRRINLRGRDAVPHDRLKAQNGDKSGDKNGLDGKQGNPGGSSGDCLLITEDLTHRHPLAIDVQGGMGGQGQDGGDGYSDGCIAQDIPSELKRGNSDEWRKYGYAPTYQGPSECEGYSKANEIFTAILTFGLTAWKSYKCKYEIYKVTLAPTKGGSGGAGGPGGFGGRSGVGVLILLNSQPKKSSNCGHSAPHQGEAEINSDLCDFAQSIYDSDVLAYIREKGVKQWSVIARSEILNGASGRPGIGGAGMQGLVVKITEHYQENAFNKYYEYTSSDVREFIKCEFGKNGTYFETAVASSHDNTLGEILIRFQ